MLCRFSDEWVGVWDIQVSVGDAPPEWTLDQIAGLVFGVSTSFAFTDNHIMRQDCMECTASCGTHSCSRRCYHYLRTKSK